MSKHRDNKAFIVNAKKVASNFMSVHIALIEGYAELRNTHDTLTEQRDALLDACKLWKRAIKKGDVKTEDLGTIMLVEEAIEKTKAALEAADIK